MELSESLANALGVENEAPAETNTAAEVETPDVVRSEEPEQAEAEAAEVEEADEAEDPEEPEEMPKEQRHANAARRRQAEQEAREKQAVEKARAEWEAEQAEKRKDFYRRAGLKNTITGEVITTDEEFDNWEREYKARKFSADLKRGTLTQEQLNEMIESNPKVKQASEIVRRDNEQRQERAQKAAQEKIAQEIAEIHELDPSISSKEDLLAMDNAKEFYQMVLKNPNMSFVEAFKAVNHDRLVQAAAQAGRNTAMSNIRGKDHINSVGKSRGTGAESVTAAELKMYRIFNPNVTAAQVAEFKNKNK